MMKSASFSCKRGDLVIRGHVFGDRTSGQEAVIISHGFMANEQSVRGYADFLAGLGCLAVTFDFNGGGIGCCSDGKTENMTVLTEREDLLAVTEAVREQYQPSAISLMGCSQGGLVSVLTARQLGADQIRRLVLFYPALCIPDDARKGEMRFYHFDPANIPDVLGETPMKLGGGYARTVIDMDPFRAISGYDGPTLLVHGTDDRIVDISYARKARAVYRSCEYHEIDGGAHGFTGAHAEEAKAYLAGFLKQ